MEDHKRITKRDGGAIECEENKLGNLITEESHDVEANFNLQEQCGQDELEAE